MKKRHQIDKHRAVQQFRKLAGTKRAERPTGDSAEGSGGIGPAGTQKKPILSAAPNINHYRCVDLAPMIGFFSLRKRACTIS
jgi:hypothetical protein